MNPNLGQQAEAENSPMESQVAFKDVPWDPKSGEHGFLQTHILDLLSAPLRGSSNPGLTVLQKRGLQPTQGDGLLRQEVKRDFKDISAFCAEGT